MITELRAQNFKSWQDTGNLRFAPLTAFFGANSSGKTSILQVLLMLKQTAERPAHWNEPLYFGDEESLVNLGSFDDVIHRPANNTSLDISVSWNPIEQHLPSPVSFSTSIAKKDERADLVEFCYTRNGGNFKIKWTPQGYRFISFHEQIKIEPFRCYGIVEPDTRLDENLKAFFLTRQDAFESLFRGIHYLGPLRENPRHRYTWEGDHPADVGQQGEKAIPALLSGRVQLRFIEKKILEWLQRLDLIDDYRIEPDQKEKRRYELYVTKYRGGPEVHLTDVGFGVSQVLPVLTQCYYPPEGSILILEQPEAHLHPKAQSVLADVLIDVVKNRNIQIILESHSENLLIRLMRRIAEEKIPTEDTALYSCQINEGVSEIEQLKMDVYGNISNWPQDFFGDEMGDLAAKAKAEIKRRKANKQ